MLTVFNTRSHRLGTGNFVKIIAMIKCDLDNCRFACCYNVTSDRAFARFNRFVNRCTRIWSVHCMALIRIRFFYPRDESIEMRVGSCLFGVQLLSLGDRCMFAISRKQVALRDMQSKYRRTMRCTVIRHKYERKSATVKTYHRNVSEEKLFFRFGNAAIK